MTSRRLGALSAALVLIGALVYVATPYARSASLFVRAANLGGRMEAWADAGARTVTVSPRHMVPTRQGDVAAQFYRPEGRVRRSVLLVPGVHSMGIAEPRLTALARDLAGSGVAVMAMALPDLMGYQITARSTDVIEDAVAWMAAQSALAPDGLVGMIGISFAGGLSIVAAGRPAIRDKVAYVVSFGGHGDLGRVLHYLATGDAVEAPGVVTRPPHDYGVAVILYAGADRVVPPEQVGPLRDGIRTFLLASQLTLVDMKDATTTFAKARKMATSLPEPAATYLTYVIGTSRRSVRFSCRTLASTPTPPRRPSARRRCRPRRCFSCTATTTRSSPRRNPWCWGTTCARKALRCVCSSARSSRTRSSTGPRRRPKSGS